MEAKKYGVRAEKGPEVVMISPTDLCNLKCKYCWRRNAASFSEGPDIEAVDSVLKDCAKLGVKSIDFTGGGEPFVRKNIFELIELAKGYGFRVKITTNGTLLTEHIGKPLQMNLIDELVFSIDSKDPYTTDMVRGQGVHKKVVESIKNLNRNPPEDPEESPHIILSAVITALNHNKLHELITLASALDIDYVNFAPLQVWESNKHLFTEDFNADGVLREMKRTGVNSNINALVRYGIGEHEKPKYCFAPWDMAFVNADGEVMVCCTLSTYHTNTIGNVNNTSFYELWNSEKMRLFRENVLAGRLPDLCKRCLPDFIERYEKIGVKNVRE